MRKHSNKKTTKKAAEPRWTVGLDLEAQVTVRKPTIWGSRTDLLGTPKPMGPTQQSRAREGATTASSLRNLAVAM